MPLTGIQPSSDINSEVSLPQYTKYKQARTFIYTFITLDQHVCKARTKPQAACLRNEISVGDTESIISDCMTAHATVGTEEWLAVVSDGEAVVRLSHLYSCELGG